MNIVQWATENWSGILQALGAFYTFATVVAAITPSDKDNTFLEKVGKLADRFGLNIKGK